MYVSFPSFPASPHSTIVQERLVNPHLSNLEPELTNAQYMYVCIDYLGKRGRKIFY